MYCKQPPAPGFSMLPLITKPDEGLNETVMLSEPEVTVLAMLLEVVTAPVNVLVPFAERLPINVRSELFLLVHGR